MDAMAITGCGGENPKDDECMDCEGEEEEYGDEEEGEEGDQAAEEGDQAAEKDEAEDIRMAPNVTRLTPTMASGMTSHFASVLQIPMPTATRRHTF
eukprot:9374243-Alexandrium_andersonii.AAC.1